MLLWSLKLQNVSQPETVHLQHLGWHEDEVDDTSWAFDETRDAKVLFYHNQFQTVNVPVGLQRWEVVFGLLITWSAINTDLTWSDQVLDSRRCPVLLLTGRREGRGSLRYVQLSSFSRYNWSSAIFCHCNWWRSFTSLGKYVQAVDSWSNSLFLSLIFNLLSKVLPISASPH